MTTGGHLEVYFTIENLGNSAQTYVADYQKLMDTEGREFSVDMHVMTSSNQARAVVRTDVNPGVKLEAGLDFNVPNDVKPAQMVFHESMHSRGVVVNLL
jgi:Domain of unknown function (DUF4352)